MCALQVHVFCYILLLFLNEVYLSLEFGIKAIIWHMEVYMYMVKMKQYSEGSQIIQLVLGVEKSLHLEKRRNENGDFGRYLFICLLTLIRRILHSSMLE